MSSCRLLGAAACAALLGALSASAAPAKVPPKNSEAEALQWNDSRQQACVVRCGVVSPGGGEARGRCEAACRQTHEAKASSIKDRFAAERAVQAEEHQLKAAPVAKGRPGPVAERLKALAAYTRALAILKAAAKLPSGRAGFIGETRFRGQRLQDLQRTCEVQFQRASGELFVYEPLAAYANQIIREYNESLRTPRYGAD